ncbi:hypothetical protein F4781DRAFT_430505 [Annulohypoxylon bovei var. microspora]|nr:hypothetical protein F4781DRAFT_430505 [Annulohypoxylon bovei var. microspora]
MLVVGLVLFASFLVWDSLFARRPFIPFRLVRHKTIVAACALCVCDFMHYSLFTVFFPSYLQVAAHFSPSHATRTEGFYQTAAQVCVQAVVERGEVDVATGVYFAAINFGGAIGTSISGAIWRSNLLYKLTSYLPTDSKSKASAIFGSIVVAQKYAVGSIERTAIDMAYRETQKLLAIAATCVLVPMLLAMWFIKNVDLIKDQREGEEETNAKNTAGRASGSDDKSKD